MIAEQRMLARKKTAVKIQKTMLRVLVVLVGVVITGQVQAQSVDETTPLDRAKILWEQVIAAKGGRERLYQVKNFVHTSEDGTAGTFQVFPDRYFSWSDASPYEFGLSWTINNYETGFGYRTAFVNPQQVTVSNDIGKHSPRRSHYLFDQIVYLLETKWLRPEVIRSSKSTIRGKKVDFVEVLVDWYTESFRIGAYLDEKTHLPLRVVFMNKEKGYIYMGLDMKGYREVRGILFPTEASSWDGNAWFRPQFEINVEYNPQFFDQVPDLKVGPFQWRKSGTAAGTLMAADKPAPLTQAQITGYLQELESFDDDVAKFAQRDLITAGRQVIPVMTKALKSGSVTLRFRVAVILLELEKENPAAMAALPGFLLDPQLGRAERQNAAFGLSRNNQGIAMLADLLRDPDPFVRRCVIFAFDDLTEQLEIPPQVEKAVPALRQLTQDKDEVISKMAKEVLEQIGNRFKR